MATAADNARRRPGLRRALRIDAQQASAMRGDRAFPASRPASWFAFVRLLWADDDFAGVVLYRLRSALRGAHIPILPRLLGKLCVTGFGIRIGDRVVIEEGLYIPHGNVVIDGITVIGRRAFIGPWVTIGLVQGDFIGPRIGDNVFIGTGASIVGPVSVGDGARIAAWAVVVSDVPPGASVAGVPARPLPASGHAEGQ